MALSSESRLFDSKYLGIVDYDEALELQHEIHAKVAYGRAANTIIALQHPNVLTFGKNSNEDFLLATKSKLEHLNCKITRCDRGGEITAHMPGQLVVYPIIRLTDYQLMPKTYVCKLEHVIIQTLSEYGILSVRDSINPGVWVGLKKICAIGIRIKSHVSMHGFALNICNSFELYDAIVPCGLVGRGVTSMQQEIARVISVEDVVVKILKRLEECLWGS